MILKTNFPIKIRDIHKIEKKNSTGISVFGYENKEKYPIYVSKQCCEEKHVDLLLTWEGEKKHYTLIKDFHRFMYDDSIYCGRKHLLLLLFTCLHYRRNFKTLKIAFTLMVSERLKCLRKVNMLNSKILKEK